MATIDFCVPVGSNAVGWADFLAQSASLLQSGEHSINYIACLSGHDEAPARYSTILKVPLVHRQAAFNHAACLRKLVDYDSKSDFIVISDADVGLCMQNWDSIAINSLQDNCVAFGFSHVRRVDYKDFPFITWILLKRSALEECNPNLSPGPEHKEMIKYPDSLLFGYEHDVQLDCDTAWQFCVPFRQRGYTGIALPQGSGNLTYKKSELKRSWREHHYKNQLFGSHLTFSRRDAFQTQRSMLWMENIKQYISRTYNIEWG